MIAQATLEVDVYIARRKKIHILENFATGQTSHHPTIEDALARAYEDNLQRVQICGKENDYLIVLVQRSDAGVPF